MTVKTDADTIRVPAHVFDSIALTVCRASVILSRVNANEPTGPDQAEAMDDNACAAVHRVRQLLLYADGPDREKFAKDMGWPSADSMVEFLFGAPIGPAQGSA